MTEQVHGMGKDLHHSEEMGGHLIPIEYWMTWLGQNSIDGWCVLVELMSQTDSWTETD